MTIKTILRFYLHSVRRAMIKNTAVIVNKYRYLFIVAGFVNWYSHYRNQCSDS